MQQRKLWKKQTPMFKVFNEKVCKNSIPFLDFFKIQPI